MRVCVLGEAASGKTTVARKLAAFYGIPHRELDLVRRRRRQKCGRAAELLALRMYSERPDWVIDGVPKDPGGTLRPDLLELADVIVHLDLPFRTTEPTVFRRHVRRGGRISLRLLRKRVHRARRRRLRMERLEADLKAHVAKTVTLRSRREIERFLAGLWTLEPRTGSPQEPHRVPA